MIRDTQDTLTTIQATFGVVTTASSPRRLSSETRAMAARYLAGQIGDAMVVRPEFVVSRAQAATLSMPMYAARTVQLIAKHAPLRCDPAERLVGGATLMEAAWHRLPTTTPAEGESSEPWLAADGTPISRPFPGNSHTTIGLDVALHGGYAAIRRRIDERLARGGLDAQGVEYLQAMQVCLDAATAWHRRHVEALEQQLSSAASADQRAQITEVLNALRAVPEHPPKTFHQAVQSLWMIWTFQRLCGNWSGLGRVDQMLGGYLRADLAAGQIGLDEARELLARFWIKGTEWVVANTAPGSGDAQFYQNVILGGIDAQGNEVTNEVTDLILDIVEELHISDFPVAVRCSSRTPERLLKRIAEVQSRGGGIVAIYNEDLIIDALVRFGYRREEAAEFTNDGCWEVLIPGQTAFGYDTFDVLQIVQETIGSASAESPMASFSSFDALYEDFLRRFSERIDAVHRNLDGLFRWGPPAPLLSLLVEGCIEKGRGYHDRGATYSACAIHPGGLPDAANSLYALKKVVFDEQWLTLADFIQALRDDWVGHEELRQRVVRTLRLYGNDDADADAMMVRVFDDYVRLAGAIRERNGVLRPLGISTFGREIDWRNHRAATPFGRRRGEILATNLAPTPGSDLDGPTAVIRSFCKMDFGKLSNGVPLELKLLPSVVCDAKGQAALAGLLRTFLRLGGWYLQVDVVDSDVLRDAQRCPERYPNLVVRISGWSARFNTLNKDWQEMIIQRTQQACV